MLASLCSLKIYTTKQQTTCSAEEDEESNLSSLLNELDDIRNSEGLGDLDDEIDMDEIVGAPPPQPQGVRETDRQTDRDGYLTVIRK